MPKGILEEKRAERAKGKLILIVGLIMITLFFALFLSLMTVTLGRM